MARFGRPLRYPDHTVSEVPSRRLDSWKEIASYLGRGLRTVQRWEREEGLPVHRLGHAKRGSVYADPVELDAWWKSRQLVPAGPTAPERRAASAPERVTDSSSVFGFPALSSDARLVAFVADSGPGDGAPQIWVQQVGGSAIRLSHGQIDCSDPSFSADDTRVIYSASGDSSQNVYDIPALGGQPRLLRRAAKSARMSPDGQWLAFIPLDSPNGLHLSAADGTRPQLIAPGLSDLSSAVWSSDSRQLLVYGHPDALSEPDYWIVPIDGSATVSTGLTRTLRSQGFSVFLPLPPAWTGDAILFSAVTREGAHVWRQRIAPHTFEPVGAPERLTHGTEMARFSAVAGGRMAFVSIRFDMNLWSVALDASTGAAYGPLRRMTRGPGILGHLSLSQAGRTLAYFSARPGGDRVLIRDLEDGSETVLAAEPTSAVPGFPALSPSGRQIAYATRSTGPRTMRPIFVVDLPGGPARQVCEDCGGRPWQWLNERLLLIELFGSQLNAVSVVDTVNGDVSALLTSEDKSINNPRISPDGAWIAFDAARPWGPLTVYVAPLDAPVAIPETAWTVIGQAASHPSWSRDGRLLYYLPTSPARETRNVVRAQRLKPISKQPDGESFLVLALNEMVVPTFMNGTAPLVAPDQLLLPLGDFRGDIWMMDV
jgi:Tol biopolymer transport system component